MAVLPGHLASFVEEYYHPGKSTVVDVSAAVHTVDLTYETIGALYSTAFVDTQPVDEFPVVLAGHIVDSMSSFWYNNIHIIPSKKIDVGNVVDGQIAPFSVWNAYFISKVLTSLAAANDVGIVLGTAKVGNTYLPLEVVDYTLTFSSQGPSSINATYTFDFTTDIPVLTVTGFRAILFGISPDWAKGVTESYTFKTNIITSKNDKEQRIGLRERPKMFISYDIIATKDEARKFFPLLFKQVSLPFQIPLWPDAANLAVAVTIGDIVFQCADLTDRRFVVGDNILITKDFINSEVLAILSIVGNTITTTFPTGLNWDNSQTKLLPMTSARISKDTVISMLTEENFKQSLIFEVDEAVIYPAIETTDLYRSVGVIKDTSNWLLQSTQSYSKKSFTYDVGLAEKRFIVEEGAISSVVQNFNWFIRSKPSVMQFLNMMFYRRGRLKPIWMSTGNADLILTDPIDVIDTEIFVEDVNITNYYDEINRRDILIQLIDGTQFFRRISTPIPQGNGKEKVSIDSALGVLVTVAEIRAISYVALVRQESDTFSMTWRSETIAESSVPFKSVNHDL